jgi:hypothetical protein
MPSCPKGFVNLLIRLTEEEHRLFRAESALRGLSSIDLGRAALVEKIRPSLKNAPRTAQERR